MEEKHISGSTEEEIWQQLTRDLDQTENLLQYRALLTQNQVSVLLDIDIDLGGGFESGFATTIFTSRFVNPAGLQFAVHPQHFSDSVGKAFGMQDALIGAADFDAALIVKTNDEQKIKAVFADPSVQATLLALPDFTLEVTPPDEEAQEKESILELVVEEGITDPTQLRQIYQAFTAILAKLTANG